jgi:hypothetical protein
LITASWWRRARPRQSRNRQAQSLEDAFLALTGIDHSRRECGVGRPDAAIRQDVEWRQTMSAIYILWLRELKRYTRSRAQIVASLGQPMLYLLVLGFGLSPVFKRAGYGSYFPVYCSGRDWNVGAVFVDFFRTWAALGSAVWVFERDAGGAGSAHSDHDWAHAGRIDYCDHSGTAGDGDLHDCGISAGKHLHCRLRWDSWF